MSLSVTSLCRLGGQRYVACTMCWGEGWMWCGVADAGIRFDTEASSMQGRFCLTYERRTQQMSSIPWSVVLGSAAHVMHCQPSHDISRHR